METWLLTCRAVGRVTPLCIEIPLGDEPVEIGRSAVCDVVVSDPRCPERALLASRIEGALVVHELSGRRRRFRAAPGEAVAVGELVLRAEPLPADECTELLAPLGTRRLALLVSTGSRERRIPLGARPVTIGAAADNDLVLSDPTVSRYHCRLDPGPHGVTVRDLSSRNGTWVRGVRVQQARVEGAARLELGRSTLRIAEWDPSESGPPSIIAESVGMRRVLSEVERIAGLPWPALIVGESGVGKEGLAKALHRAGPFVALNAGGLPPALIESELFGHERGSFTGAVRRHEGVFEQAQGGTLFLDEVGELPLEMQARLLRVLETWQIRRVGGDRSIDVHVRLVCATHRDLRAMVDAGAFREDLYFRISRLVIEVPPLRKRKEDIAPLARHFLKLIEPELGVRRLDEGVIALLREYDWPGNARELRNVVSAAAVDSPSVDLDTAAVARALRQAGRSLVDARDIDKVLAIVDEHGGNIAAAAKWLGVARTTLRDRIARHRRRG